MVLICSSTTWFMHSPTPNDDDEYTGVQSSRVSCSRALATVLAKDLIAVVSQDDGCTAQEGVTILASITAQQTDCHTSQER